MWFATLLHYPLVIITQILKDILLFPLWWYSLGLYKALSWFLNFCAQWWQALGVAIWLKYLFVPMYGQTDFFGRLISLAMRLVQIFARSLAFLIIALMGALLIFAWLALPLVIIGQIIYQIRVLYG